MFEVNYVVTFSIYEKNPFDVIIFQPLASNYKRLAFSCNESETVDHNNNNNNNISLIAGAYLFVFKNARYNHKNN